MTLVGIPEKAALFHRARVFKLATFTGALALGLYERSNFYKRLEYMNRYYPEPTEFQRDLIK